MFEGNAKDPLQPNPPADQTLVSNQPPAAPSANTLITNPPAQNVQQDFNVQAPMSTIPSTVVPAGIRLRFSAAFFDSLIFNVPIILISVLGALLGADSLLNGFASIILYIILIAATIGYFVYFHTRKGATPGKAIYGLKVIDFNTKNNLSTNKALIREIVARGIAFIPLIGFIFLVINFFVVLSSSEKRGIHDKVADSQVLVTGKSWSLIKQIGLFILLIGISIAPYMLLIPKLANNKEEVNKCVLECMEVQNYNKDNVIEFQRVTQFCNQKCAE